MAASGWLIHLNVFLFIFAFAHIPKVN